MSIRTRRTVWLVLPTAMLAAAVAAWAAASGPFGNPPRVVPFRGQLALDGNAFSGSVPMTFFFVKAATQTSANQIWSEDYPEGVAIAAGQFTVNLGSKTANTGIPDTVLAEPELYIGMKVNGNELNGLQRFFATPYSINAAQAQNFTVRDTLSVANQITFPNQVSERVILWNGGGSDRYGIGLTSGTLRLFVPPNPGARVAFGNADGGDVAAIYGDGRLYAAAGWGYVPIGTIMAWHKSMPGTPALPIGWVECNGQLLSDSSSPYNGQTVPNLNGERRFLRGNGSSGTMEEATSIGDLAWHSRHVDVLNDDGSAGTAVKPIVRGQDIDEVSTFHKVRPVNMSVVWIMRVK